MGKRDYGEPTFPEILIRELSAQQKPILRITVMLHPGLQRVGDCAEVDILSGEEFELSRLQPLFAPRRGAGEPKALADPYLSRQPLALSWWRGDLLLRLPSRGNSVYLDGKQVSAYTRVAESRLRAGVVLVLAHRIVLYCQLAGQELPARQSFGLIGESDSVQSLRKQIDSVAASDAPVLLLGESGTGKELVARAIHRRSPRREAALVAINMAAIPTELASAELFGARRGAYTGADRDKAGYFMQAEGGTLFMDEIGATSPSVQTQLLRVLETSEIQPTGGVIRAVQLRVISATDANLDEAEQGFSKALRHRLGGLELRLPPLRERRDDIGRLVVHFLQHYFTEAGAADQLQKSFQDPPVVARWSVLLAAMAAYPWPGNVRELRNFCRQVVLFSKGTGTLLIPDNALEILAPPDFEGREQPSEPVGDGGTYRKASRLSDDEVCEVMKSVSFEISRAARELNVARPSLYKRIESVPGLRLASDLSIAELEEAFRESGGEPELGSQLLQVSRSALQRRWRALELL